MDRQTGITTEQIRGAPVGAIYVWVNSKFSYPKNIAKKLGRNDLRFISPEQIKYALCGVRLPIVVDHAAEINHNDYTIILERRVDSK